MVCDIAIFLGISNIL